MQHVNVVLYNNFTALDAFGPVEVLNRIEDYKICFVSLNGGLILMSKTFVSKRNQCRSLRMVEFS